MEESTQQLGYSPSTKFTSLRKYYYLPKMPTPNLRQVGFAMTVLTVVGLATISSPAVAVSMYSLTDLGTLSPDTTDTRANAINNLGQVVGREVGTDQAFHSFIWENGNITQLPESIYVDIVARSINDRGNVVGTVDPTTAGQDAEQGFFWTKNASGGYDGAYYGDYPNSLEKYFRDVNNNNQVAGNFVYSRGATGVSSAFYWENGITTILPTLGGDVGAARAINDLGELVGNVATAPGQRTTTAALWQKDSSGNFTLQNLGTFGGLQSSALNINNVKQVIGQYTPIQGQITPFLWQNGTKTDLGSLGGNTGSALGINNLGLVVGSSNLASGSSHAFLWENGGIFDLNSVLVGASGWELTSASGINDRGEIVGYGSYLDDKGQKLTRAYLLKPIPESSTTLGLLVFGVFGTISLLRRKRQLLN